MDVNYEFNDTQINIAKDNSTINATQIVNYLTPKTISKLMTPDPLPYSHYVSRNNEDKIIEKLKQNKRVFLHGVGGIGKTTLAKKIYELSKDIYDHLAWIEFKENWKISLINSLFLSFFNFEKNISEDEKYNEIIECLTNLQNKKILIVVDNFNSLEIGELNEILRIPVTLLITTRGVVPNCEYYYDLASFNLKQGTQLFIQNYAISEELTVADTNYIEEIVEVSHGYPLAIELIAKAVSYKNLSIKNFVEELRTKEYKIEDCNLVADSDWNGVHISEKIAKQLSKVYELSELSLEETQIIKIMSILPAGISIASEDIQNYLPFNCKNAQISLVYRGWITQSKYGFSMHEIVCECVYNYNVISYKDCELLLSSLETSMNVSPSTSFTYVLKYAKYTYNVIGIMKKKIEFCKHLFLKEAALVFKENGYYQKAKELLDILIKSYDESNINDKEILAEIYNNYSKILSIDGDVENALSKALHAEKLIDSIYAPQNSADYFLKRMIIKKTVAMDYAHYKQYILAIDKIREAMNDIDFISPEFYYQITNLYSDYARLLLDSGDISGCIEIYKKVLVNYDSQNVEQNNPWRYTTYTYLANAYTLNKEIIYANNYAFQALTGKYHIYSEDNYAIGNALLSMANIYKCEKRLWDVAEIFYKKAILIFQKDTSCDNYCRCLAGLSIVTQDINLAFKAYDILQSTEKKYDTYTYIEVMEALISEKTASEKALYLGEKFLQLYAIETDDAVLQYIYALMGKVGYLMKTPDTAKTYLQKIDVSHLNNSTYFYQAIEEIKSSIPLSKIYSLVEEKEVTNERKK